MSQLDLLTPSIRRVDTLRGFVLEPTTPLPEPAPTVLSWVDHWAQCDPDHTAVAERGPDGRWRGLTYGALAASIPGVARLLARRGAGVGMPVMLLSGNSVTHALVTLAAFHLGAPVVPISTAYATASSTHERLSLLHGVAQPAVVFVDVRAPYEAALRALGVSDPIDADDVREATSHHGPERASIGPGTIAKVLFTSGSTGLPKGVVNTHRMLTANQEMLRTCWPFLETHRPVVVDWLPWSHTFGGNHNMNLVLRNGGTLYIDAGRPAPGLIETTLRNMADVGPNLWFNVPRGFDQAVEVLEGDAELSHRVFRHLRLIFYAAAALTPSTRRRLQRLAAAAGREVFFTSAWGSTETAPLATSAHFETESAGVLGVPVPGTKLAMVRHGGLHELRVKGPHVTPGYWLPGGSIEPVHRDAQGFLSTGDAGHLVDADDPNQGVAFAGRIGENFKLSSGTWVRVGRLRVALVDALSPFVHDVVVAGHDGPDLGLLVVPAPGRDPAELRARLLAGLRAHNRAHPANATHIARALVLDRPLSLDHGETTDKGYTNQRGVLEHRAAQVKRLFAPSPDPDVLVVDEP